MTADFLKLLLLLNVYIVALVGRLIFFYLVVGRGTPTTEAC